MSSRILDATIVLHIRRGSIRQSGRVQRLQKDFRYISCRISWRLVCIAKRIPPHPVAPARLRGGSQSPFTMTTAQYERLPMATSCGVFNDRGAFLASAAMADSLRLGSCRLQQGLGSILARGGKPVSLEKLGNPNVVTLDKGTSCLSGSSGSD